LFAFHCHYLARLRRPVFCRNCRPASESRGIVVECSSTIRSAAIRKRFESDRPSLCAIRSNSCLSCGFTQVLIFPLLSFFGRSRISFSPSSAASSHCCAHNTCPLAPSAPHQRIIADRLNAADAVEFSFGPTSREHGPDRPHTPCDPAVGATLHPSEPGRAR
jgi:hypothetical protein